MTQNPFDTFKSNLELNPSFDELVSQRHNAIRSALQNLNPNIETKLIGSMQRRTRIQPLSPDAFDVDILVILGSFYSWLPAGSVGGVSAPAAQNHVHDLVSSSDRYGAMGPVSDPPTITLKYADGMKIELVPAYKDEIGESANGQPHQPKGRAYWVPVENGWQIADYDHDARVITAANDMSKGLLVPAIKMMKAARREWFPQMKSFHLEILAALTIPRLVQGVQGNYQLTGPDLAYNFFADAQRFLGQAVKLPGSLSPALMLSTADAQATSVLFGKLANFCQAVVPLTSEADKKRHWRTVFGEPFPLS